MRWIYSLEQHLIVKSPTTALERLSKNPNQYMFPIKVYRHNPIDQSEEDPRFIKARALACIHIATIEKDEQGHVTISFTSSY